MRWGRPLLLVLLVVGVIWVARAYDLAQHASLEGMRALVDSWAPYGPLVFIGVCILGIFLHMPELVLIAVGGVLFDAPLAFAYGWVAALVGTTATFLLVRYFARDAFQRTLTGRFGRLQALDERLARNGFVTVLVLRLLLCLAPPLNWTLGATRVGVQQYVAGTALGVVPGIATAVYFAEAIANRDPGAPILTPGTAVAALLILGLLVAAAIAGRRLLGNGESGPQA
jgi:uncharacterized membrane protein YdjX (TVP38/TMEM64 family)